MDRTYYDIVEMTPTKIVVRSNSPLTDCGDEDIRLTNKMIEDDYAKHGDTSTGRERTLEIELAYSSNKPFPFVVDDDGHLYIFTSEVIDIETDRVKVTGEGTKEITITINQG